MLPPQAPAHKRRPLCGGETSQFRALTCAARRSLSHMNQLLMAAGIEHWKPVLSMLLIPPVPFLLLALAGALAWRRSRRRGGGAMLLGLALTWASLTVGAGEWLHRVGMPEYPAFSREQIAQLRTDVASGRRVAIVALGAGRERLAPEYGLPSLRPLTMERLRYAIWLSRQTGAPLGYTGGVGHAAVPGPSEAEVARRITQEEFGLTLRWAEDRSRDTRENGRFTVPMLQRDGIDKLVLVTHDLHMPRALRAFREAAAAQGIPLEVVPAPAGISSLSDDRFTRWFPSSEGQLLHWYFWHEKLGWWAGA